MPENENDHLVLTYLHRLIFLLSQPDSNSTSTSIDMFFLPQNHWFRRMHHYPVKVHRSQSFLSDSGPVLRANYLKVSELQVKLTPIARKGPAVHRRSSRSTTSTLPKWKCSST